MVKTLLLMNRMMSLWLTMIMMICDDDDEGDDGDNDHKEDAEKDYIHIDKGEESCWLMSAKTSLFPLFLLLPVSVGSALPTFSNDKTPTPPQKKTVV